MVMFLGSHGFMAIVMIIGMVLWSWFCDHEVSIQGKIGRKRLSEFAGEKKLKGENKNFFYIKKIDRKEQKKTKKDRKEWKMCHNASNDRRPQMNRNTARV